VFVTEPSMDLHSIPVSQVFIADAAEEPVRFVVMLASPVLPFGSDGGQMGRGA
jgi:hypothetical protein